MTATMNHDHPALDVLSDLQWLRAFALRLADPAQADDLVQDTWIAAWRAAPARSEQRPLRPWLASVLRNRLRTQVRDRARREAREQRVAGPAPAAGPEDDLQRMALLRALVTLIAELPEVDQRILTRRFADDYNATEIAEALGMPAATVRSRLKRALARLREELDARYGGRAAWAAVAGGWPLPTPAGGASASVPASASSSSPVAVTAVAIGVGVVGLGVWATVTDSPVASARAPHLAAAATIATSPAHDDDDDDRASVSPPAREAWQRTKDSILAARPPGGSAPTPTSDEANADAETVLMAMVNAQRDVFDACVADLSLVAGESLTVESDIVGAPRVGTIVSEVRVRGEAHAREALVECLTEGMYTVHGPAPAHFVESQMSFGWGTDPDAGSRPPALPDPTPLDATQTRRIAARAAALQDTLGACPTEGTEGTASLRLTVGDAGTITSARFVETALSLDTVDCMADVMLARWTFEDLPAGTVFDIEALPPAP